MPGLSRFTLRTKLILFIGIISVGMGLFFCGFYIYQTQQTLTVELTKRGLSIARNLAHNSKYGILSKNERVLHDLIEGFTGEPEVLLVVIFSSDDNILAEKHDRAKFPDVMHEQMMSNLRNNAQAYEYAGYGDYHFLHVVVPVEAESISRQPAQWKSDDLLLDFSASEETTAAAKVETVGYVQIFWSMQKMQDEFERIVYLAIIITVLAVATSVAVAVLLGRLILKPVREMNNTALKIAQGDLSLRVTKLSQDELGQFTDSFNFMVDSLQKREGELNNTQAQLVLSEKMASLGVLISGIAHEINTPTGAINNAAMDLHGKISTLKSSLAAVKEVDAEGLKLLQSALEDFTKDGLHINKEESWKRTRQMRQYLADAGVGHDREVAATLDKFGLLEEAKVDAYKILLRSPALIELLDSVGSINMAQEICQASATKISQIVKALKYYAYTDMDKSELVDINESVENVLVLMHNKFKYQFDVTRKYGAIPKIYCTSEINQVWTNLLSNAYDAVVEKGQDVRGKIDIETAEADGHIAVRISDNGSGISPENTAKIFDPFFTTKGIGKGVGLGLSIVAGIVKKHNGKISATSVPGQTTFTVLLPEKVKE